MQKKILYIYNLLIVFILLFNPPIIQGSYLRYAIYVLALLYVSRNANGTKAIFMSSFFRNIIKTVMLFFIYYGMFAIINFLIYSQYEILYEYVKLLIKYFAVILTSMFLILFWDKNAYSLNSILKLFVYAAVIQSCFTILAFIFPSIRSFFVDLMLQNARTERMTNAVLFSWRNDRRLYGFSDNLYDLFGFSMSVLAVIALYIAVEDKKKKYMAMSLLISISAILNARTSLIIIAIGIIVMLFWNVNTIRKITLRTLKFQFFIVLSTSIAFTILAICVTQNNAVWLWMKSGFDDINALLHGRYEGVFLILFDSFLFFPESIQELIFGTGLTPQMLINKWTDVGYVINIFMYGILGSLLLYRVYTYILNSMCKRSIHKTIYFFLKVSLFAYLFKSNIIGDLPLSFFIFPVSLYEEYNGIYCRTQKEWGNRIRAKKW